MNPTNVLFLKAAILILANHLEIGITTRLLLDRLLSSDDITDADVRLFYNGVRLFYETTFEFIFIYLFIFYLFNVGNENIQLNLYRKNSFSITKC